MNPAVAAATPADHNAPLAALRLGGMTPLTTIDFPGRLAAVLYCQGCPWRCSYCHNPALLDATQPGALPWDQALQFLQSRQGLLDGVVFSGGEPTLQSALPTALATVRGLGLHTALHTGGMYPERLAALLPLLDWVGLDIKGPAHCYADVTGTPGTGLASAARAFAALHALQQHGTAYECRTTWHPGLFDVDELMDLAETLAGQGVQRWALQACRTPGDRRGAPPPLTAPQQERLRSLFPEFILR